MKLANPYDPSGRNYSFDLNEKMLDIISKDFQAERVVSQFSCYKHNEEEVDSAAKEIFGSFGKELAARCLTLGEEYADRTWEMLKLANEEASGTLKFPLFPQRFIEIAYLSIQPQLSFLQVVENNRKRFIFRLDECSIFAEMLRRCERKLVAILPCEHACRALCQVIFEHFGFQVRVEMGALMSKEDKCEFQVVTV